MYRSRWPQLRPGRSRPLKPLDRLLHELIDHRLQRLELHLDVLDHLERVLAVAHHDDPGGDLETGPRPGETVSVIAEDKVPEAVVGEVAAFTRERVSIRRSDDQVGEVVVHFPRVGYVVRAA